jgi:hypothetical protein
MPLTFILLQTMNCILAGSSLWIHFKNPLMWDDQAMLISALAGTIVASITAILLGISLLLNEETKWGGSLINLMLTLSFGGLQGYLLFLLGREMGILNLIKSRLG